MGGNEKKVKSQCRQFQNYIHIYRKLFPNEIVTFNCLLIEHRFQCNSKNFFQQQSNLKNLNNFACIFSYSIKCN